MDDLVEDVVMPVKNIFGAVIFWLYIILALVFTGLILDSIARLPAANPSKQRSVRLFSFLALFSFTALSFNMLHVLLDSFTLWRNLQPSSLILSPTTFHSTAWQWSITSTLFKDFGMAIVGNLSRYIWTQAALWTTMSICLYMSVEGTRRRIPRLWAYFALSQILPISFVQNLFYIAQLKAPISSRRSVTRLPTTVTAGIVLLFGSCLVLSISPVVSALLTQPMVFDCLEGTGNMLEPCVSPSNVNVDSKYLLSTIMTARLLLLLPLFLPKLDYDNEQAHEKSGMQRIQLLVTACAMSMTVEMVWLLCKVEPNTLLSVRARREVLPALWSHPAVTSLGFDFLVSAVCAMIWVFGRHESDSEDSSIEESVKSR